MHDQGQHRAHEGQADGRQVEHAALRSVLRTLARSSGTCSSRASCEMARNSSVIAIANTPSLNASSLLVLSWPGRPEPDSCSVIALPQLRRSAAAELALQFGLPGLGAFLVIEPDRPLPAVVPPALAGLVPSPVTS